LSSEWCCGHTVLVAPYLVKEGGAVAVVVGGAVMVVLVEDDAVVEVRGVLFGLVALGADAPRAQADMPSDARETNPSALARYFMSRHMGWREYWPVSGGMSHLKGLTAVLEFGRGQ